MLACVASNHVLLHYAMIMENQFLNLHSLNRSHCMTTICFYAVALFRSPVTVLYFRTKLRSVFGVEVFACMISDRPIWLCQFYESLHCCTHGGTYGKLVGKLVGNPMGNPWDTCGKMYEETYGKLCGEPMGKHMRKPLGNPKGDLWGNI